MFSILFVLVFFLNIDYSYQQTCQFSSGIEYLGLNLPNMPIYRARTITDCCNYCLANPQCQSWDFINDRNCPKCYLKSAIGNSFRYNFNSYYGTKQQIGPATTTAPITTTGPATTAPLTTTRPATTAPVTTTSPNVVPGQPFCVIGDNTVYSNVVATELAFLNFAGLPLPNAFQECCTVCAAFPICTGFNFNKLTGDCTLLDRIISETNPAASPNNNFASGFLKIRG